MFLSKREALTVAKLVAVHNQSLLCSGTCDLQREVEALKARVEQFLTGERVDTDEDEDEDDWPSSSTSTVDYDDEVAAHDGESAEKEDEESEEEDEDEAAEDDSEEEEDSSSEEDEEDDEGEGEGEESSEEDDAEDELDAEFVVNHAELADLGALKTSQGELTFVSVDGTLELHLEDDDSEAVEMDGPTHLKRFGKELHVRDADGEWEVYDVKRFPKAWTQLLPLEGLCEIEADVE